MSGAKPPKKDPGRPRTAPKSKAGARPRSKSGASARRTRPQGGREKGHAKLGDGVIGVAKHARGFQIRFVKNGRRITVYRAKEASANEFAARKHAELLAAQAAREAGEEPEAVQLGDGLDEMRARYGARSTLEGQQQLIWDLQLAVAKDPRNEDYQRALRTQAAAMTAQAKMRDRAEDERTLARVEQKFDQARKRRAAKQVDDSAQHNQPSGAHRPSSAMH